MKQPQPSVVIADWPLWQYWRVVRYSLLIAVLVNVVIAGSWWFYQLTWWWLQLTLSLATVAIIVWQNWKAFQQPSGQLPQALVSAGFYGWWIGLAIGLVQFSWQPAVWSFFYLIAIPCWQIIIAVSTAFVSGYVYLHWWPGHRSAH